MSHPRFVLALAPVVSALISGPLLADTVTTSMKSGYVQAVTVNGSTIPASRLLQGQSSGAVTFMSGQNLPTPAADDVNLATYFARNGVSDPNWDVDFGTWFDTNGAGPDFFVFEVGGNDSITVRPLLIGGGVGQPSSISGWTSTGYAVPAGPNKGQMVFGLSFRLTDLKDAAGIPLTPSHGITGLRIVSNTVDGASVVAVDPNPPPYFLPSLRDRVSIDGVPRVWQRFDFLLKGLFYDELDGPPNPFLDVRAQVTFVGPSGQVYDVPAFFAGNGKGVGVGEMWKARFVPDEAGSWQYTISYRTGPSVAISLDPFAGTPFGLDGMTGSFTVLPPDPNAQGFARHGRLGYVGGHYLRFADGTYFLKGGVDSPENLLAYFGFDDPQDSGNLGIIHHYPSHIADFQPGDPAFTSNAGSGGSDGIIGALNYLSSSGVNSVYVILMNLGGDGQDVFPFVGASGTFYENLHYDVSKLEQWNTVFEHAQRLGIMLHFVLGETEPGNETWLSNGTLGAERKLYYREMVARFGHLLALKWNISEENDFNVTTVRSFADFIAAQDPYDSPIAVHSHLNSFSFYDQIYGDARFAASSMQYSPDNAGQFVETLRTKSSNAGHKWVIDMDENGSAAIGLSDTNADDLRRRVLWDVYLSGGQLEWYCGAHPLPVGGDQTLEDFRTREDMWDYMRFARTFMETHLPFWEMQPQDALLTGESSSYGGGEVFAKPNQVYAVYLPSATSTGSLNLSAASGSFTQRWFNPRTGQFNGSAKTVTAGGTVPLGPAPHSVGLDWVVLIER